MGKSEVDLLKALQEWYASMCNDDWEHTHGLFIGNIDNPGWSLKVELEDAYLCGVQFDDLKIQRDDENDWILCRLQDWDFQGYGGPGNLSELIAIFLNWAEVNR
jgi:hypothetical protein